MNWLGYPLVVISSPVGLAGYCVGHVLVARLVKGRSPYFALTIGFGVGLLAVVASTLLGLWIAGDALWDGIGLSLMNGVGYAALGFGYFNFVNLSIASLRIRMLEELLIEEKPVPRAQLLLKYGTEKMLELRLSRLVIGGHLVERNGRLVSGRSRFLLVARLFGATRRCIIGPTSMPAPNAQLRTEVRSLS